MIDLHLHSTASDGELAPARLVARAKEGGLTAIALTDHDTLDGIPEAMRAGEDLGIEVVPGVEISLDHGPGTFHMIGLLFDPGHEGLGAALRRVREGRAERNRRLVDRLAELGVPVAYSEVESFAGGDVIARPHFARAMVERGHAGSLKEAFDRWLGKGEAGYVDRERLETGAAIDLVHDAGGVTVLCHPGTLGFPLTEGPDGELGRFVRNLAARGLDAMEVRYAEPDPGRERSLGAIADGAGLLPSGGTDYHGHTRKDQRSGLSRSTLDLPMRILDDLKERSRRIRAERRR